MESHGYTEFDDIDIVDHEAFAMRRGNPQTTNIHMTQQMTTKVAPAYDGRTKVSSHSKTPKTTGATLPNWKPIKEAQL